MSEGCDCEKNSLSVDWPEDGDFGDNYLKHSNFPILEGIRRYLSRGDVNKKSVFNQEFEEKSLTTLNIDEVDVDYSYLEKDDFLFSEDVYENEEPPRENEEEQRDFIFIDEEIPIDPDDF